VGVVVATGAASELGRIGVLIGAVEPGATPLMRQMQSFARQLTVATLAVAVATFGVATLLRDYPVDHQTLAVRFFHATAASDRLVYIQDTRAQGGRPAG